MEGETRKEEAGRASGVWLGGCGLKGWVWGLALEEQIHSDYFVKNRLK